MQITVLVENTASQGLCGEHGLSLYLRHAGRSWLLDAGQSEQFAQNALVLDCPLEEVSAAVLSHGHYDHADGLPTLLQRNPNVKVYARTAAVQPRYDPHKPGRYIGICAALTGPFRDRLVLGDEPLTLAPGLWLIPDALDHEQSLVAEGKEGLVIMNSCCHAGVAEIVAEIKARFPGKPVRAVLGGFHLMGPGGVTTLGKTPEEVAGRVRTLLCELEVGEIYTGHCTGQPGFELLKKAAPERVHGLHTGDVLEF